MNTTTTVGARFSSSGALAFYLVSTPPRALRGAGGSVSALLARLAVCMLTLAVLVAVFVFALQDSQSGPFLPLLGGVLKFNKKWLGLKNEVTYGTDAVPTGAANAFQAYDVQIKPLRLNTDRRDFALPWFGNQGDLVAGKFVEIDFKVPMSGAGAAGTAPAYGPAFKACALSETVNAGTNVVYAPVTPSVAADVSCDIYFNVDGRLHKITGAIGDATACLPAGKKPYFQFHFVGLYNAPTDTAIPALTLTAWQKELPVNNANTTPDTLFTFAAKFRQQEIMLGNRLDYRNLPNSEAVRFLDRESSARFTFESEFIAAKDWWSSIVAETTGAYTVTQGTVAGNKVTIAAPNVQLLEPDLSDDNGVAAESLTANLRPSSAGNDELSITVL